MAIPDTCDFDTPENIKSAAITAIKEGFTKYTPSNGIIELKQAISDKLKNENNISYSPDEILVSCGGKHSLFNAMEVLLEKGDEAILPSPYWITYEEQINIAGATPVILDTTPTDFKLTAESVEKVLTDKTKLLILNSPSNPTGAVIEDSELAKIADLAVKKNFYIISDEVYEKFIFGDKKHLSIASLNDDIKRLTVTINAVSKSYSMTGWRIGYAAGSKEIIKAMGELQSHSTSNACSISQKAALEAITGPQEFIEEWKIEFDKRRIYMVKRLNEMEGIKCLMPEGAFYTFPDITGTGLTSMEFTDRLLDEQGVAVVPGKDFGSDDNIRLSYATSMENINKGLDRIKDFCDSI